MFCKKNKEKARESIKSLIKAFKKNEKDYCKLGTLYNETQARTEFITPFLESLGWDVHNKSGKPLDLREVIEEATVEVGENKLSKKPDYELKIARQRKFFVESKKPSINILSDKSSSFQVRRYGFSASMPISVLTNFRYLAIYDCSHAPLENDEVHVSRLALYSYEEFETKFDEIYEQLSWESIYTRKFDEIFKVGLTRQGSKQFDDYFLSQVRDWRLLLAQDIHFYNNELDSEKLTYIVQRFLSRIIFLRICEDRNIEKYETLKNIDFSSTFDSLMKLLAKADEFYDSGLFDIMIDKQMHVQVGDKVLKKIIKELYYPKSPYTFSVVEPSVLGEIYELFLSENICIEHDIVSMVEKPEVRESGGVVSTPQYIVREILEKTLAPAIRDRNPDDLKEFTVADICCGSGIFLISIFEFLLNYHLDWYVKNTHKENNSRIYDTGQGIWQLQFSEKKRILLQSIRGVDVDPNAVEIAKFSLLLKLIENESSENLQAYRKLTGYKALPSLDMIIRCGNSLIDHSQIPEENSHLEEITTPFTWDNEFPNEMSRGGFDVIVGNPPYIRIQKMLRYSPEEVALYKMKNSPYQTAKKENFDKYSLFIERSLELILKNGIVGMIVPHKFMITSAGSALRTIITKKKMLKELIHFGAQQVFGKDSANYTCILVLQKESSEEFVFEKVANIYNWQYGGKENIQLLKADSISADPWTFISQDIENIFNAVREKSPLTLCEVADIFVGAQTSKDPIYIFSAFREEEDHIILKWDSREWLIEKEILRPCLKDITLIAYSKPKPNKYMIFPYKIDNGQAQLIQPSEMREKFPLALEYLTARRSELEDRNITGGSAIEKQWYQFGRSQSLTKFSGSKIILPVLSVEPRYSFDDKNTVVTGGGNGPYYLIRPRSGADIDLFFLMAVLCHPLSEAMIRCKTSVFRGGYYSHGKQFIEHLPIPNISRALKNKIATLVIKLIECNELLNQTIIPHKTVLLERKCNNLRSSIEDKVSLLLGLSKEELLIIKEMPIPT